MPTLLRMGRPHAQIPTSVQSLKTDAAGVGSCARQIKNPKMHNKMSLPVPQKTSLLVVVSFADILLPI